jgi:hypothetical protein
MASKDGVRGREQEVKVVVELSSSSTVSLYEDEVDHAQRLPRVSFPVFENNTKNKKQPHHDGQRPTPKGRMAEWQGEDTQACAPPAVAVAVGRT